MNAEDRRFIRGVYQKAEARRHRHTQNALKLLCVLCACLLVAVVLLLPERIELYGIIGAALLCALHALQWMNLELKGSSHGH